MTYATTETSEYAAQQTFLYLFALPDRTLTYTNAPRTITATISGNPYDFTHPRGGISHSEFTLSADAGRTGLDIRVSHVNPIVRAHRTFPPAGDTEVTIYRQNEIGGVPELIWLGVIVETPIEDSVGILRCQHIAELVSGAEGLAETFAPTCPYQTYHFPCPVPAANYRQAVTVTAIDLNNFTVTVTGITQPADWFTAGVFEALNGDKRFILDQAAGVLTLQQNFPALTLKVGDNAVLLAGDDHLFSTCQFKFGTDTGNGAAFGGNNLQANKNPHQTGRIQ